MSESNTERYDFFYYSKIGMVYNSKISSTRQTKKNRIKHQFKCLSRYSSEKLIILDVIWVFTVLIEVIVCLSVYISKYIKLYGVPMLMCERRAGYVLVSVIGPLLLELEIRSLKIFVKAEILSGLINMERRIQVNLPDKISVDKNSKRMACCRNFCPPKFCPISCEIYFLWCFQQWWVISWKTACYIGEQKIFRSAVGG